MKIVHISTSLRGGAGICASRIINATSKLGVENRVLLASGTKNEVVDVIKPIYPWSKIWPIQKYQVIKNLLGKWPLADAIKTQIAKELKESQGTFTSPITNYTNIVSHPWVNWADIIHLHWVGGFLDYESFFSKIDKPIVWTAHDENQGLGGFHYTMWRDSAPESFKRLDKDFIEIKRRAYSNIKSMTLVAISSMMADFFSKNELLSRFPNIIIHNGILGDSFTPIPTDCARQALSIPNDSKVFLFISQNIHEDRKGLKELVKALEILSIPNTLLICLGNYNKVPQSSFEIRCEGFVGNNRLQSLYYSASDYFVMPSYQESFGQTPIEAMSCGTPVIAFPCGIIPEIVNHDNGVVCDDFTVDALVNAIKIAMNRKYVGKKIREDVLSIFSYDIIAKQYVELYKAILAKDS